MKNLLARLLARFRRAPAPSASAPARQYTPEQLCLNPVPPHLRDAPGYWTARARFHDQQIKPPRYVKVARRDPLASWYLQ